MTELRPEVHSSRCAAEIGRGRQRNLRIGAGPLLVFKPRRLQTDRVVEALNKTVRIVDLEQRRALMGKESVSVDQELIALGFATEDRMIIENEACFPWSSFTSKDQPCRESADSAADNHAIVGFSGIYDAGGKAFEIAVADFMTGVHHREGITVRMRVVADAAVAGKVVV